MYRISKKFEFSAAHALTGLPPEHQCSRVHGHNYIAEVVLESATLTEVGFIRDYNEMKSFKEFVDKTLDHRWLGWGRLISAGPYVSMAEAISSSDITESVLDFNPTAENMASYLYTVAATMFPEVSMVGVSETPKTWAWHAPQSLTLDDVLEITRGTEVLDVA